MKILIFFAIFLTMCICSLLPSPVSFVVVNVKFAMSSFILSNSLFVWCIGPRISMSSAYKYMLSFFTLFLNANLIFSFRYISHIGAVPLTLLSYVVSFINDIIIFYLYNSSFITLLVIGKWIGIRCDRSRISSIFSNRINRTSSWAVGQVIIS